MATQRALATKEFSFTPTTLEEAQKYANIIANSGICPEGFRGRPNDVLIVLQLGSELGLKPMQALRSLGSINGMPFAYGDGLLALVKRHAQFKDMKEWFEGAFEDGTLTAFCTMTRNGQEPVTQRFSMEDAKRAGLWGKKGPWTQYPRRMLQHRARGFAAKDAFPDAIFGLMSEDEARGVAQSATIIEIPKVKGKGIQGLEESLGINDEKIVDAEVIANEPDAEVIDETHKDSLLDELQSLILETETSQRSIDSWLVKAGAERLEDLTVDVIQKAINHFKTKGAE